ncbi:MAG TPA: Dyp-type peroxidase [Kofleriaceae bacterium]|nr:Dyp-type peroxidase [Kofleriaceae bacterium]
MNEPQDHDLKDIQGLIYRGWTKHPYAGFLFARLPDFALDGGARARQWLRAIANDVTAVVHGPGDGRLQLALSYTGLRALGVPDDVIGALPGEMQKGMASRQASLADTDPATWTLGGPERPLDVLVLVYARDEAGRAREMAAQRAALEAIGAHVYPDELSTPLTDSREHFGFADGLSQPFLPGLHDEPRPGEDRVPAGEILLGYPNAYRQTPLSPTWGHVDLGRNGSYLVFRKLAQNVAGFWGWLAEHARRIAGDDPAGAAALTEWLGAKVVGRWPSGAPLVLTPERDDPAFAAPEHRNAFKYLAHDPDGMRCPISSHIRRANPRDARGGSAAESELVVSRHRILRRGRSFGAPLDPDAARRGQDDGATRGLYFLCLQSSIARGFEFIQQTWLANPGFAGLYGEPDPIIGDNRVRLGHHCAHPERTRRYHITIPADPVRLRLENVPTVVSNLGGEYFLLPSIKALHRIARGP